jgi:AcrR family transcriptional regulator
MTTPRLSHLRYVNHTGSRYDVNVTERRTCGSKEGWTAWRGSLFWLTENRKSAAIPTAKRRFTGRCTPANELTKKQIYGAICMPRVLRMKSLMVTPRGPYRPSNLPNVLQAAMRAILNEAGPDAVSLREAARRVGVSATAAYRHFANKEHLLASVAAEGLRELAAAMVRGATGSDPLGGVGLAYFDFALQKRGLFRLMFGPILLQRAKYPELNEAASAVFGLLQRVAVSDDQWPCEDDVAGMAAWGLVMACSTAASPRRAQAGPANEILVQTPALS